MTTNARPPAHPNCDGGNGDRGTAVVELTLLTPLILLIALFVIACGRCVESGIRVSDAAHQAARAASLTRFPAAAQQAADTVIAAALPLEGASCRSTQVEVDTSRFRAGGSVTVTVSCTVSLADLSGLPLPAGARTQTASFTSPIDTFRSVS